MAEHSVIRALGLSKHYRLGEYIGAEASYRTLRETLQAWIPRVLRSKHSDESQATYSNQKNNSSIWALRDVSFTIMPGETVGVLGRNGAGKSTLLKILSGITSPTEGRVEMIGRVASLLEVGTGFHPEMTGRENVFLNGSILGMSRRETAAKFDAIVDFAEIEPFINTPVKRYSSGMRMRLAFSVAANLRPDLMIVDEVLAVGDLRFRMKCVSAIKELTNQGMALLFVSHSVSRVRELCDRALLLRGGRLVADGPTAEVVDEYLAVDIGEEGKAAADDEPVSPAVEVQRAVANQKRCEYGELLSVVLASEHGVPVERVVVERSFRIRLIVDMAVADIELAGAVDFYVGSTLVFGSRQLPIRISQPGRYELDLMIPTRLLSTIEYRINASVSVYHEGRRVVMKLHNALKFEPQQVTDLSGLPLGIRNMTPGLVAPHLDWDVGISESKGAARRACVNES